MKLFSTIENSFFSEWFSLKPPLRIIFMVVLSYGKYLKSKVRVQRLAKKSYKSKVKRQRSKMNVNN